MPLGTNQVSWQIRNTLASASLPPSQSSETLLCDSEMYNKFWETWFSLVILTHHKAVTVTNSRKKRWGRGRDKNEGNQEKMRYTFNLIHPYVERVYVERTLGEGSTDLYMFPSRVPRECAQLNKGGICGIIP